MNRSAAVFEGKTGVPPFYLKAVLQISSADI